MNGRGQWEDLMDLMELERGVCENYNAVLLDVRASLHTRDWPALELALRRLEILTGDLENIEGGRQVLSENLGGNLIEKRVAELPDESRKRFTRLKFELRANLLKIKSRVRGMAAYTESRGGLARELMESLIPSARGRIYNERGQTAPTCGDPLVVSHDL